MLLSQGSNFGGLQILFLIPLNISQYIAIVSITWLCLGLGFMFYIAMFHEQVGIPWLKVFDILGSIDLKYPGNKTVWIESQENSRNCSLWCAKWYPNQSIASD